MPTPSSAIEPVKREHQIERWPIDRLVFYARNPRKNDAVVDRMCSSIREFGFKIPVLARSDGEVVDGHLRLKAAQKLRITEVPVILCDEWSAAQVKAFRLMVNRSVTWAQWDDELLALELQELNEADFDLSLTGFDPKEIDDLLLDPADDDQANAAPPLPENPVSRLGDLWLCGPHRVLCGDATSPEAVATLLGDRKPALLVTDPPYGIELDSEWRDRAGLNGCGPAEASYMKQPDRGPHRNNHLGRHAGRLVRSLRTGAEPRRSPTSGTHRCSPAKFWMAFCGSASCIRSRSSGTRAERCSRGRTTGISMSRAGTSERRMRRGSGRPARTPPSGIRLAEVHHGRLGRREVRPSNAEARRSDAQADPEPHQARRAGLRAVPRQRNDTGRRRTDRARLRRHRAGSEVRRCDCAALADAVGQDKPRSTAMVARSKPMAAERLKGAA